MTEIPKIVQQRLATSAQPGAHPEADLLTSFVEQTLSDRERNRVLAHLAQCGGCREVVILAAPQIETARQESPVRSRWLGWPALRWGALAACAVVVVGAVSLRQRSEHPAGIAMRDESPQVAIKPAEPVRESNEPVASNLEPNPEKDRVTMDSKARADLAKPQEKVYVATKIPVSMAKTAGAAAAAAPVAADKLALSAGALGGAAPAENKPDANRVVVPAAPTALPMAREQVEVNAAAPPVQTEMAQATPGKAKEATQQADFSLSGQNTRAKREAMTAQAASVTQVPFRKLTPRWTLSADGTLQRSLDGGKNWKTIPVAAGASFTAVAAMDSDIWVGGSHGALYHSIDAGEHWTQVIPANNGQSLTSNIIGIEFTDVFHGKITVASQEVWTTSDGGQNWQISR